MMYDPETIQRKEKDFSGIVISSCFSLLFFLIRFSLCNFLAYVLLQVFALSRKCMPNSALEGERERLEQLISQEASANLSDLVQLDGRVKISLKLEIKETEHRCKWRNDVTLVYIYFDFYNNHGTFLLTSKKYLHLLSSSYYYYVYLFFIIKNNIIIKHWKRRTLFFYLLLQCSIIFYCRYLLICSSYCVRST